MAQTAKKLTPTNLQPQPGYVLVEPAESASQTESGIYLPDSHEEKPQQGVVLSVGSTLTTEYGAEIKTSLKPGDHVVYKKWGGNEVKILDKEYQFLKFDDVLAIIK